MHKCMHKGNAMRDNRTKQIIRAGGLALGVSMTIADPFVAEVIGAAGFDFVLIDTEHAPIAVDQLQMLLIALRTSAVDRVRPAGRQRRRPDQADPRSRRRRSGRARGERRGLVRGRWRWSRRPGIRRSADAGSGPAGPPVSREAGRPTSRGPTTRWRRSS